MWLLWYFQLQSKELGCVGLIGGQKLQIFLHCYWLGFAFLVASLRDLLFCHSKDHHLCHKLFAVHFVFLMHIDYNLEKGRT